MKRYLSLLMGILGFVPILAQQSDYYYYYKGNRIDLIVDSTRLYVVSEGELQPQMSTYARAAEYTVSNTTKSYVYNHVVPLQKQRTTNPEVYFSTLEITEGLLATQYDALVDKVKAESNVWQVLPSFTVEGKLVNVSNNFYVKLRSPDDIGKLQQMATQYGVEIIGNDEFMPLWYTLSCNAASEKNAIEAANLFMESQQFVCSEPEFCYSKATLSNDEMYSQQWNLKNTGELYGIEGVDINVEEAWNTTKGSGVVVAVFDQGVDKNHPDLNIYPMSYDATTGTSPSVIVSNDESGHGTACAGIIAAKQDNEIGISGIAPESQIMPISISLVEGEYTSQQIAHGFSWAWRNGADIISNSWGGMNGSWRIDEAIDSALCSGRNGKGCVVVFAAGNDGGEVCYPANSNPKIITVGGITPWGKRTTFGYMEDNILARFSSCYGSHLDVVAPSMLIPTTDISGNGGYNSSNYYHNFGGTSAACPHVAGIAALLLSVDPELTSEGVASIIEHTARKVRNDLYIYQNDTIHLSGTWNNEVGYGLVDAARAVDIAKKTAVTTYIRNQVFDWYTHITWFYDKNVEVENVVIDNEGTLEIDKDNTVLFKSSVEVKKGGFLIVYKEP